MVMFNTIEEAIQDIKVGKMVIIADDENRENEGDLCCAAEKVTPEIINFMTVHGRGLICLTLTPDRVDELEMELIDQRFNEFDTAFTVFIDAARWFGLLPVFPLTTDLGRSK